MLAAHPVATGASFVMKIRQSMLGPLVKGTSIGTLRATNGLLAGFQPSIVAGGSSPAAVYTRPVQPSWPPVRRNVVAATAAGAESTSPTPGLMPENSALPR